MTLSEYTAQLDDLGQKAAQSRYRRDEAGCRWNRDAMLKIAALFPEPERDHVHQRFNDAYRATWNNLDMTCCPN